VLHRHNLEHIVVSNRCSSRL